METLKINSEHEEILIELANAECALRELWEIVSAIRTQTLSLANKAIADGRFATIGTKKA